MYNLSQKLLAEFIGTFTLVFIGEGSVCADQYLHASGASGSGLLAIAAAHGLALAILISAVGHISGGHLNPAVTIGFWVTKKISTLDALSYWVAQVAGAIVAAYLLTVVIPEATWRAVGLGTPDLATDFTRFHGIVLESITTFLLVFVVFATAADPKGAFNKIAGFPIGLTVMMGILVSGPFTGGAMNPARAFGPALIAHHWTNHGVYWVGPLIGGVVAGWLYNSFLLKES
ncbi:MAG: MIP/aquaporin family protein [Candidatus Acidiferrales bacterium]